MLDIERILDKDSPGVKSCFDILGVILVALDIEGRVTFLNKRGCDIMGYKLEEVIGKSWFDNFVPEQTKQETKEVFQKLIHSQVAPVEFFENPVLAKNGEQKTIFWHNTILRDEKGDCIGTLSSGEDLTELKLTKKALGESEQKLRSVFDNARDGIALADTETKTFSLVNKSFSEMIGYSYNEIINMPIETIHPKESMQYIIEQFNHGMNEGVFLIRETPVRRKDGSVLYAEISGSRVVLGNKVYLIGIFRDITERKRTTEEREKMHREITKANKKLKEVSLIDAQTGLYNHRYLIEIIESEFSRAARYAHQFSVIMMDIDYFNSINDVYGYEFGDLILIQLSALIKKMVRRYDVVARFGGEEFVIICPGIGRYQALALAERLLDAINLCNFGNNKKTVRLRLSMAVTAYPDDKIKKGMDAIELASRVLSKAKAQGGNRVLSSLDIKGRAGLREKPRSSNDIKFLKEKIKRLTTRSKQNIIEAVFAFAKTVEVKDHRTGEHMEKTVRYAADIARTLKLPKEEIEHVKLAAMLHDLGKIGVSEKILNKHAKLSDKEFQEIKKHAQIGVDIIRPIHFLHSIIPLILYHHERWDGKGYPVGLKGTEIPIGARIIALADVYEALTADRPYRKAYSKKEAIDIIKKGTGTQFDPQVVRAFMKVIKSK